MDKEHGPRERVYVPRGVVRYARARARPDTKRVYLWLVRLLAGPNARQSISSSLRMSASVRCLLVCGDGGDCANGADGGTMTCSQTRPSSSA